MEKIRMRESDFTMNFGIWMSQGYKPFGVVEIIFNPTTNLYERFVILIKQ
ncbi:MAG: hypothetical protein ACRCZ0_08650 [Cetobacterium sp.]